MLHAACLLPVALSPLHARHVAAVKKLLNPAATAFSHLRGQPAAPPPLADLHLRAMEALEGVLRDKGASLPHLPAPRFVFGATGG